MNCRRRFTSLTQSPSSPASSRTSTVWPWWMRCSCCGSAVTSPKGRGIWSHGIQAGPTGSPRLVPGREPGDGHRVVGPEVADPGAAQVGEVGAKPKGGAQVVGQAAGVGPGRAGELEAQAAVLDLPQRGKLVDCDLLGLVRHLLAAAGQL